MKTSKLRLVFDVETNDLLNGATQVWSLVIQDYDTGAVLSCSDYGDHPRIVEGLEYLYEADVLYAHNAIDFDIPVLKKLYKWSPREDTLIVDTLVQVRNQYAHVKEMDFELARRGKLPAKLIGSQSLEAWGYRIGVKKGTYGDRPNAWDQWTPAMQAYCQQDVEVNVALAKFLRSKPKSPDAFLNDLKLAEYLAQQERNGWPFDFRGAVQLQAKLSQRREELGQELIDFFGSWEVVDKVFTPKRDNSRYGYKKGVPVTKMKTITFNPQSRDHIADRLTTLYGWKPTELTPSGKPKVDETTLKGLSFPMSDKLVEYLLVSKRLGQLAEGKQAWLGCMTHEGYQGGVLTGLPHIHHSAQQVTITHRHRHAGPNVAQVPTVHAPYGKECRALWTVPAGWKLVGVDVSGLELRCLAHYLHAFDGGDYANIVLTGDVHQAHADAIGCDRNTAKTFGYAYLYGAGHRKLGSILEPTASERNQMQTGKWGRQALESKIPALGELQRQVRTMTRNNGYVKLIDGRRAYVRSEHAALNVLLQGTGSVACMKWITTFDARLREELGPQGWEATWAALGWIHDEVQVAAIEGSEQDVAAIIVESIGAAGRSLGFNVPLDGEASIGTDWSQTH